MRGKGKEREREEERITLENERCTLLKCQILKIFEDWQIVKT